MSLCPLGPVATATHACSHLARATLRRYKLHVALRHDSAELPGSPFYLTVSAGPASAVATTLPTAALPLTGRVGPETDGKAKPTGCLVVMQAADKMGNPCTLGGAKVLNWSVAEGISCRARTTPAHESRRRTLDGVDVAVLLLLKSLCSLAS